MYSSIETFSVGSCVGVDGFDSIVISGLPLLVVRRGQGRNSLSLLNRLNWLEIAKKAKILLILRVFGDC